MTRVPSIRVDNIIEGGEGTQNTPGGDASSGGGKKDLCPKGECLEWTLQAAIYLIKKRARSEKGLGGVRNNRQISKAEYIRKNKKWDLPEVAIPKQWGAGSI